MGTIVYCNRKDCVYYKKLDEKHYFDEDYRIQRHFDEDYFSGICTREKLFVGKKEIHTDLIKHDLAECKNHSRLAQGHMDFSRYPNGGRI